MKIFVKETCEIPLYPEFKAGDTYVVDDSLGRILIDRGFATEFDNPEALAKLRGFPHDKFKNDEALEENQELKEGKKLKKK